MGCPLHPPTNTSTGFRKNTTRREGSDLLLSILRRPSIIVFLEFRSYAPTPSMDTAVARSSPSVMVCRMRGDALAPCFGGQGVPEGSCRFLRLLGDLLRHGPPATNRLMMVGRSRFCVMHPRPPRRVGAEPTEAHQDRSAPHCPDSEIGCVSHYLRGTTNWAVWGLERHPIVCLSNRICYKYGNATMSPHRVVHRGRRPLQTSETPGGIGTRLTTRTISQPPCHQGR